MSKYHHSILSCTVFLLAIIGGVVLSGCNPRAKEVPRLRIDNEGRVPIKNLVVIFPEDSIEFGDVPVGTITEYKYVHGGVYSYADYQFEVDGQAINQDPDFIGASPLDGTSFTYIIYFDPRRQTIETYDVKNDD